MRLRYPLYFIMVLLILLSVSVFAAPTNLELVKEYELILFCDEETVGDTVLPELLSDNAIEIVPFLYDEILTASQFQILLSENSYTTRMGFPTDIIKSRLRFAVEF